MAKYALLATLEAKQGKEAEVAEFLRSAVPLAKSEPETVAWFAFQSGPSTFHIYDTFEAESGREAHLTGEIAKALMAKADELLALPPEIKKVDILGEK